MKKLLILLIALMLTQAVYVNAQPQWKFYLAFEDGIGAKDTMWFIWDTTATFMGYDTLLGEKPLSLNNNVFNVYTFNNGSMTDDTIKTVAYPYDEYFEEDLQAFNYVLPLKISWDTSLFHADYLPPEPVGWVNYAQLYSDYFFWVNNNPNDQDFDMTIIDTVMSPDPSITDPWFWQSWIHFPLSVYMHQEPETDIKLNFNDNKEVTTYPNPLKDNLHFDLGTQTNLQLSIYNSAGERILFQPLHLSQTIDISTLPPGIYVYLLTGKNGFTETGKIIKE